MKTVQKKQIVRMMGILLLTFVGVAYVYGQSYQQSLLLNKEWVNRIPGKTFYSTHIFTNRETVIKDFINNGVKTTIGLKNLYYLSDEVVEKFQLDSVGKSKTGKYIVRLSKPKIGGKTVEQLEIDEILELTDTILKTKHLRSGTILEYYTVSSTIK